MGPVKEARRKWIQQNSQRGRKRSEEKSPKWNVQNKMAEISPNMSVIIMMEIDYIKTRDNQIVLKNPSICHFPEMHLSNKTQKG